MEIKPWLPVANIIDKLPRTVKAEPSKFIAIPRGLMIHHEGSKGPEGSNAAVIANYHVKTKRWGKVAYHFIIERDGAIKQCLELWEEGVHSGYATEYGDNMSKTPEGDAQYYNKYYYAACIVGNDPTPEQTQSLASLILALQLGVPGPFEVIGHKDAPGKSTECPGTKIKIPILLLMAKEMGDYKTGDPFFDQFPDWRSRAINAKGVADQFGNALVEAQHDFDLALNALDVIRLHVASARNKLKLLTGKA